MNISSSPTRWSKAAQVRSSWLAALLLACVVSTTRLPAAGPEFITFGEVGAQGEDTRVLGISADGAHVVGFLLRSFTEQEAFIWNSSEGVVLLGAPFGSQFKTVAMDVSADGMFIVGTRVPSGGGTLECVRWSRSPTLTAVVVSSAPAGATGAISNAGDVVVGTTTVAGAPRGYRWTPAGGQVLISGSASATAVSPDGRIIIGRTPGGNVYRLIDGTTFQDLGRSQAPVTMFPMYVSATGGHIVGRYAFSGGSGGTFLWTETASPQYVTLAEDMTDFFGSDIPVIPEGLSVDGRITVLTNFQGGIFVDGEGPIDIQALLKSYGIDLPIFGQQFCGFFGCSEFSEVRGLSDDGLNISGYSSVGEGFDFDAFSWRVRFHDVDENGIADEIEAFLCGLHNAAFLREIEKGTTQFANAVERETLGYGDMISQYGRPWKRDTGRIPSQDVTQPAEYLRALVTFAGCPDGTALNIAAVAEEFFTRVAFPAVRELHSFEMLLGNEAYADALDPTIGLDGIPPDGISEEFAFKGVEGIEDLLDEELALLRGRELPGEPAEWVDESIYYPEIPNPGNPAEKRGIALYNRLPPNAAAAGPAYKSNYKAIDNYAAAGKFPQGHGDAYGHYLTAVKAGIRLLTEIPDGLPESQFHHVATIATTTDLGLETVRRIAEAGAARARNAAQVAELLYRRDYREDPEDSSAIDLFIDPDRERAWSMGEWARRGAAGAYLDWALAAHWAPTDEARPVRRKNLPELDELAGAVSSLQERLDTAGKGLDPLGLVQNVVPFGIDAAGLDTFCAEGAQCSGSSHYQQVSAAARKAIDNARRAFESANQTGQRLRDSDKSFNDFADRIEDTTADFDQQLIEIFGLPSPSDPADNDLDGEAGEDIEESESSPDLTTFFATDDVFGSNGMAPRPAPGQVQLSLSELRVAALGVVKAEIELDNNADRIQSQIERIELVSEVQMERVEIITEACEEQKKLTRELEKIQKRKKATGILGAFVAAYATPPPQNLAAFGAASGQAFTFGLDSLLESPLGGQDNEFDIEVQRMQVQCNKEIKLQGLEDVLQIDAERRQIKELLRQTPVLIVARHEALEVATQALGRLNKAVAHGRRLIKEKRRLLSRTEGDLLEERWRDMSFRVFRNAALKNYRAFFDIAARYVVLSARAYAYEFNRPSSSFEVLTGIYRQRRLGGVAGGGGLQGVLEDLDGSVQVNNFNRPLESLGQKEFSFAQNLLGVGFQASSALRFRAFLESQIVERVEELSEVRELAQLVPGQHFGPGIVIPFGTEIEDNRNFFGRGPEPPYGNINFPVSRNAKIRTYAISLDGVDASVLGIDPNRGSVSVYLLPVGESMLRENTTGPVIEAIPTPWAVIDQFLPPPPLAQESDFSRRSFNPWSSTAQSEGNYLNEIKRHLDAEAQVDVGFPPSERRFNTNLAGRSAWNTRWLFIIPGRQWSSSSNPAVIRQKLLVFIYGSTGDPGANRGIFDIRLIIQGYSH